MIATITEQRMRELAAQLQNTYVNFDGSYGNQCWDSAVYINSLFGLPVINTGNTSEKSGRWPGWAGNMVDCFPQTAAIAEAYELVAPDQPVLPGDTLVWDDSNREWYPATHVATAIADTGRGWVLTLSQNSSAARPDLPRYSAHSSGPIIQQTLPKKGLLGIIRPRTGGISYAGANITEIEDDMITPEQMQELKDFTFKTVGTMLEQFHNATRSNIIGELSKKIEDSEYETKVFVHGVDNQNTDRAIMDNRAQEEATRGEIKDVQ